MSIVIPDSALGDRVYGINAGGGISLTSSRPRCRTTAIKHSGAALTGLFFGFLLSKMILAPLAARLE